MIFDSGALKDFIAIAMQTCGDNTVEKDTRRSFSANSFSLYNALLFLLSSHHTPQFHKLVAQLGYADINTWWEQSTSLSVLLLAEFMQWFQSLCRSSSIHSLLNQTPKKSVASLNPLFQFFKLGFRIVEDYVVCMRSSCPKGMLCTLLLLLHQSNGVFAATQHHLPSKPYSKCGGCKVITYCEQFCFSCDIFILIIFFHRLAWMSEGGMVSRTVPSLQSMQFPVHPE